MLKITDEGSLKVYAPAGTSRAKIERVINDHSSWVEQKIKEAGSLPKPLPCHTYSDRDVFYFHDKPYELRLIKSEMPRVYKEGRELFVCAPNHSKKEVKKLIEQFYDDYGLSLFSSLVLKWIRKLGLGDVSYEVAMVNYPKRLGSCSSRNVLSFSRRSLMLPLDLLDYLALHEVAHLVYFNHSVDFKRLLASQMSDYKERYNRIKQLRYRISHI